MTLGTKLYNLRRQKNISLDELSLNLDISKTAIGKWEADKTKPNIENLLKLCSYYETDVYNLLEDVSNINFMNAKFKGNSYAAYAQNFTVNNDFSSELLKTIITNQKIISDSMQQQNRLIDSILNKD